ncbi:tRNA lysidine(34) synthetase TilS [Porticoccus sp.]|uniref:tRNA lysidine(34) synthetase TilS n=1 Tax=Porticoccus sp. TaxID=2024853 RepID=UPI003F69CA54
MTYTPDLLAPYLPRLREASHCYVGYSGGLDSHVLLVSLVKLLGADAVSAIHVNHQLSPNAGSWQAHCQQVCDALGVTLNTEQAIVIVNGQGVEDAARTARYQAFEKLLPADGLLLLGHHADDQVETVLYRLLRGSGPRGLAGMPVSRYLGGAELLRPLLSFTRSDLEKYAMAEELLWIEDESNEDVSFDRNFLRHKVIPILAAHWPDYAVRIAHSARLCRDSDLLSDLLAAQDLIAAYEHRERLGWSISLEALLSFDELRQANLLRHWAGRHHLAQPGHKVIDAVLYELLPARVDAEPLVSWAGIQLRRYQRRLYLLPADPDTPDHVPVSLHWDGRGALDLPDKSTLSFRVEQGRGIKLTGVDAFEVRFRNGGERCKPVGRSASNTLKKLFQEYGLEPWLRSRVPLIYRDGILLAVGDLWICDVFQVQPDEQGYTVQWDFGS